MASLPHGFEEPGDIQDIRLVVDTIPTLAWSARADGSAEFFNQRWLDYTGLAAEQALASGWEVAIHPDDLPRILETFREALRSVKPYEVEGRFRRFDGEFRWFLFRFELANGETIFLDEIGKLPLDTQVALLIALKVRRAGSFTSDMTSTKITAPTVGPT
jgi:PAS domain S-box-containing protein